MISPTEVMALFHLPEMRKGKIGICVATLIARFVKPESTLPGWNSQEQAWAQTQGQLSVVQSDGRSRRDETNK